MVKEAIKILESNTAFSIYIQKRTYGFLNKKYDNKYYFDCSSFCFTILSRTFNFPPKEENKDKTNIKIWSTHSFLENIQKNDSIFDVVETINIQGQSLDLKKLQIGDFILGQATNINEGINHIMLYVGEGNIIHCTKGRYLRIQTKKMRDGVVKESLYDSNYYTELESLQNILNGIETKRFDSLIAILRYKEKENE